MANQTDPHFRLAELFKHEKCYTIDQLSRRLSYSLISIRRFLKTMGYYTSFTHNSKWYTLRSIPSFNKNGIWFYQDIGFCKHGNLNQTIGCFIDKSFQGLTAKDLFNMLSVIKSLHVLPGFQQELSLFLTQPQIIRYEKMIKSR